MGKRLDLMVSILNLIPEEYRAADELKAWIVVAMENVISALRRRQYSSLSLIEPLYLGKSLHELATEVGSPLIITNDMRLTSLSQGPWTTQQGRNITRTITRLCKWIIDEGKASFACPYAGCPGCPPEIVSSSCRTDARAILALPDNLPECCLSFSAEILGVRDIIVATL
jgi:hypothetical protein